MRDLSIFHYNIFMKLNLTEKDFPTSTFACGPGQGHTTIRQTPLYQAQFERSHRAADISENVYHAAELELRKLLAIPSDYLLCFFPGGATPALDAVTWSLTLDSVSGLSFGAFSKRWCEQIAAQIPDIKRDFKIPSADTFFPAEKPNTNASLILLTPNETSTGVQIPDDYLLDIWHAKGLNTLVAWDCTSCAGGRVLPSGAYDIMAFGLQKCFGAGGGTAALILSPRAVERISEVKKIRQIPYSLDLSYAVENAHKFQTINTPSTINIWMCGQAAYWMNEHGGLIAMEKLCRSHADFLFNWAAKTDWLRPMISDAKLRSYTTPTFKIIDSKISADDINRALANTGLPNLQDGIKKFTTAPANTLRIACFPFIDTDGTTQYAKLTRLLDEIVRQLRA